MGPQGALGKLTDGIKILNSETGAECPPARFDGDGRLTNGDEAVGELVGTQGLGLFDGYYNDAEANTERLRGGMFWSGDFGYADENGYVFFTGRSLDRLRVDGENFGAAQVERVLAALPGIEQFAVYGVPDVAAGDQVMLSVVMDDFDPPLHPGGRRTPGHCLQQDPQAQAGARGLAHRRSRVVAARQRPDVSADDLRRRGAVAYRVRNTWPSALAHRPAPRPPG
jgi:acyl-CoA synthetase (AMP-forming)/AMP-acid ligase II